MVIITQGRREGEAVIMCRKIHNASCVVGIASSVITRNRECCRIELSLSSRLPFKNVLRTLVDLGGEKGGKRALDSPSNLRAASYWRRNSPVGLQTWRREQRSPSSTPLPTHASLRDLDLGRGPGPNKFCAAAPACLTECTVLFSLLWWLPPPLVLSADTPQNMSVQVCQ